MYSTAPKHVHLHETEAHTYLVCVVPKDTGYTRCQKTSNRKKKTGEVLNKSVVEWRAVSDV